MISSSGSGDRGGAPSTPHDQKPSKLAPVPAFAQRVLAFETYIGFQHEVIGVVAGVVVALALLRSWLGSHVVPLQPGQRSG